MKNLLVLLSLLLSLSFALGVEGKMETRTFRATVELLTFPDASVNRMQPTAAAAVAITQSTAAKADHREELDCNKSKLIVINTAANLELVEDFVRSLQNKPPKNLIFTLHLFEATSPALRQLLARRAGLQDHRYLLDELRQASQAGRARSLSQLRLETKSGQRAKAEDTIEKFTISSVAIGADGEPVIEHESRAIGPFMEVDAVINPDGWTLDLAAAFKHTPSPPQDLTLRYTDPPTGHEINIPQWRFHQVELRADTTLHDGNVKLLGLWKSTGPAFDGKDVLQCALIEAHIVVVK